MLSKIFNIFTKIHERTYLPTLRPEFEHLKFGSYCLQRLLEQYHFQTVLDVGSGAGLHSKIFTEHGKIVTALDYGKAQPFKNSTSQSRVIITNFDDFQTENMFDCIWCSHILEHQPNSQNFLKKVNSLLLEGGTLAITVPPMKSKIVGGHLSVWNAGLLLYHLILANFDCRNASILRYGYNISIIIQKRSIDLPDLCFGGGDIDSLSQYFPIPVKEGFNGEIHCLNW